MTSKMETVQAFYGAFGGKDWAGLRSVLADDFTFRGALAEFETPDAFVEAMKQLPFDGAPENSRFIEGDGHVVHTFVWKMTAPAAAEIPMCEVLQIKGGKVASSELFYDSKLFPVPA